MMRTRIDVLDQIEWDIVELFSSPRPVPWFTVPWFPKDIGEKEIAGTLAIDISPAPDGGVVGTLVYDAGERPIPVPGWRNRPLEEIEERLEVVAKGIAVISAPLTFAENPVVLDPHWLGWGPLQIAAYFDFFGRTVGSRLPRR